MAEFGRIWQVTRPNTVTPPRDSVKASSRDAFVLSY